ncbi:A24 family peptidase [Streptomyces sp. H27-D2]|uniref:A24 family peptidase n=1 Tax=Streptomyces sp. H27-D2 TaxID=3046304 RepID=UPI002DB9B332|nr:A24 family peptidase [Streptomyces sp. H27-D2]MEC4016553.1 A24 family peptidase [Streptomyces sp. H27-D2]
MLLLLIALAAVYGAAAGSLVPRAAYRLAVEPEDSWQAACPAGHAIAGRACGWLGLARCAGCSAGTVAEAGAGRAAGAAPRAGAVVRQRAARGWYGPRTPLMAAVTALVCGGLAAAVGARPELAVWLLLAPFAALLAAVDLAVHRLPDVLTLPLAGGVALLLGLAALSPGDGGSWPAALLGGLLLAAAYFVLFLINPNGMGFGDVKLALTLGVALGWYGWGVLFLGAFAGFLLGALYGIALMLLRRADRKSAIPFGPFMVVGALGGVLLGGLGAG